MPQEPPSDAITLRSYQSSWRPSSSEDRGFNLRGDRILLDEQCREHASLSLDIVRGRLSCQHARGTKGLLAELLAGPLDQSMELSMDEFPEGAQTLAIALCQAASEIFDCRISVHLYKQHPIYCSCLIGPGFTRPLPIAILTTPCVWTDQIGHWPGLGWSVCSNFGAVLPAVSGAGGPTDPVVQVLQRALNPKTELEDGYDQYQRFIDMYRE